MKNFFREVWKQTKLALRRGFRMALTSIVFFAIVALVSKWSGDFAATVEPI